VTAAGECSERRCQAGGRRAFQEIATRDTVSRACFSRHDGPPDTVGGIIYQGSSFPSQFRNTYIAADLIGHNVHWHRLEPWGATFRSSHGGELLLSNDTWFAPSDVTMGPDGAVYAAHPDPDAEWDKSTGRIYKIDAKGAKPVAPFDLGKLASPWLLSAGPAGAPGHGCVSRGQTADDGAISYQQLPALPC
jgi:hypothetical protein